MYIRPPAQILGEHGHQEDHQQAYIVVVVTAFMGRVSGVNHIEPNHIMPCHVMSCHVMSCQRCWSFRSERSTWFKVDLQYCVGFTLIYWCHVTWCCNMSAYWWGCVWLIYRNMPIRCLNIGHVRSTLFTVDSQYCVGFTLIYWCYVTWCCSRYDTNIGKEFSFSCKAISFNCQHVSLNCNDISFDCKGFCFIVNDFII